MFFRKYSPVKIAAANYALLYTDFDQAAFLHLIEKFGLNGAAVFRALSKGLSGTGHGRVGLSRSGTLCFSWMNHSMAWMF